MNSSLTRRPILVGALVAPLGGPPALLLYQLISDSISHGRIGLQYLPAILLIYLVFGVPVSYISMAVLGLPYVAWLRRTGRLTWLSVCGGAAALGAFALPTALWLLSKTSQPSFENMIGGGLAGLACGALFCVVAWPNNSFKPNLLRSSKRVA